MVPQASALTAADTVIDCVSSNASTNNSNTDDANVIHQSTTDSRQARNEIRGVQVRETKRTGKQR